MATIAVVLRGTQTHTESVSAFTFDTAVDEDGVEYQVDDEVTISLAKSSIDLHYPLFFQRVRRGLAAVCHRCSAHISGSTTATTTITTVTTVVQQQAHRGGHVTQPARLVQSPDQSLQRWHRQPASVWLRRRRWRPRTIQPGTEHSVSPRTSRGVAAYRHAC